MFRRIALAFTLLAAVVLMHVPAHAQVGTNAFVRNYLLNQPTVSPYLNLLRIDAAGTTANYQTLVRPLIDQQDVARLQQVELSRLQQQVGTNQQSINQIRDQRGQRVFSTGHQTRFMNYSRYYPGLPVRR